MLSLIRICNSEFVDPDPDPQHCSNVHCTVPRFPWLHFSNTGILWYPIRYGTLKLELSIFEKTKTKTKYLVLKGLDLDLK